MSRRLLVCMIAGLLGITVGAPGSLLAQRIAPPPPERFVVEIRYRIVAPRNERARQLLALFRYLDKLGFTRDPEDIVRGEDLNEMENPQADRLRGTISSANARGILGEPSVRTVLLLPMQAVVPPPDRPVRVDLELSVPLDSQRQQAFAATLNTVLQAIGFREAVGYDRKQFTRLLGTLPVAQLEKMLADLRLAPEARALLPRTLLNDLKQQVGGPEVLREILVEWFSDAEGKALMAPAIADWGLQQPALEYISTFALDVRRNEAVVQELLLGQVQTHPDGAPFLERLFDAVVKSRNGGRFLDQLLTRLRGRKVEGVLPGFFRGDQVFRILEVRPDLAVPAPRPLPPPVLAVQLKLSDELRELLLTGDNKPRRMELILTEAPRDERAWKEDLQRLLPRLNIEGHTGALVAIFATPNEAQTLSTLQSVSSIRLPRSATSTLLSLPAATGSLDQVLARTGVASLHRAGFRGQRTRTIVVASDFRGWESFPNVERIDLTTERNANLFPDPQPAGNGEGEGLILARTVRLSAPSTQLTLVRVDASAPHLLHLLMRRINGEEYITEALIRRGDELAETKVVLNNRQEALRQERDDVLGEFPDDRVPDKDDKKLLARRARRDAYFAKQKKYDEDEAAFARLTERYLAYRDQLRRLAGNHVIVCGLDWTEGHPADGQGPLTNYLDEAPLCAFWVQAAGNSRDQAWVGTFADTNGDGVMEFASSRSPLPTGNWDHQLNFLAWESGQGGVSRALPAQTRIRLTLQWREAQDASFKAPGTARFRPPLSFVRMLLLQQIDPEGRRTPSDDLAVVAESAGLPQLLYQTADSSVYEMVVDFTTPAAGHFAVRVEGIASRTSVPQGSATLPAVDQVGELRPRLFVHTATPGGRLILDGYRTHAGEPGTLAAAHRTFSVTAIDAKGTPQAYASEGPPAALDLSGKPESQGFDRLLVEGLKNVGGTGIAAAFRAGQVAALLSSGMTPPQIRLELGRRSELARPRPVTLPK